MKFEGSSSNGTRVIERKRFSLFGTLWPWPLISKSIGVFYSIRATTLWSLKALAQRVLKLLSGNIFTLRVTVTLTFDLLTPKSIGVFYLIRATTLWSLKALAQRVLKLLSGNGFHSLGHCDLDLWPTDPKLNKGLLLNKGYIEGSGSKGTRVIERKRSVTDGQTDKAKTICLPQRGGRHNEVEGLPLSFCFFSQTEK